MKKEIVDHILKLIKDGDIPRSAQRAIYYLTKEVTENESSEGNRIKAMKAIAEDVKARVIEQ